MRSRRFHLPRRLILSLFIGTRELVLKWLGAPNYEALYEIALSQRMANTGAWFVQSTKFTQYMEENDAVLWAVGSRAWLPLLIVIFFSSRISTVGSGKTVIA